jgi:hypothetical protein
MSVIETVRSRLKEGATTDEAVAAWKESPGGNSGAVLNGYLDNLFSRSVFRHRHARR